MAVVAVAVLEAVSCSGQELLYWELVRYRPGEEMELPILLELVVLAALVVSALSTAIR